MNLFLSRSQATSSFVLFVAFCFKCHGIRTQNNNRNLILFFFLTLSRSPLICVSYYRCCNFFDLLREGQTEGLSCFCQFWGPQKRSQLVFTSFSFNGIIFFESLDKNFTYYDNSIFHMLSFNFLKCQGWWFSNFWSQDPFTLKYYQDTNSEKEQDHLIIMKIVLTSETSKVLPTTF